MTLKTISVVDLGIEIAVAYKNCYDFKSLLVFIINHKRFSEYFNVFF